MKMLRLRLFTGAVAYVSPLHVESIAGREKMGALQPGSVVTLASGASLSVKADPAEVMRKVEQLLGGGLADDDDAALTGAVLAGAHMALDAALDGPAPQIMVPPPTGVSADEPRPLLHHMDPDLNCWMPVPLGGPDYRTPTQKREDTNAQKRQAEADREERR